jgi:hypothetical protein
VRCARAQKQLDRRLALHALAGHSGGYEAILYRLLVKYGESALVVTGKKWAAPSIQLTGRYFLVGAPAADPAHVVLDVKTTDYCPAVDAALFIAEQVKASPVLALRVLKRVEHAIENTATLRLRS